MNDTTENFKHPIKPLISLDQVRRTVLSMQMAKTLQLRFTHLDRGVAVVEMPVSASFCFRPDCLQATGVFAIADFAAVAAAATTLPEGWLNATVDGQLKLVAPATGPTIRATGTAVHTARLLTVCSSNVFNVSADGEVSLCATFLGTARNIESR